MIAALEMETIIHFNFTLISDSQAGSLTNSLILSARPLTKRRPAGTALKAEYRKTRTMCGPTEAFRRSTYLTYSPSTWYTMCRLARAADSPHTAASWITSSGTGRSMESLRRDPGQPYYITVDGDIANTGNTGYEHANLVGNPHLSNPTTAEWFNTAAFAIPATYTFGNEGRNILYSDSLWNLDLSMFRQFPIGERMHFELRGESFNLFNHPVYGVPNDDISNCDVRNGDQPGQFAEAITARG